jgi:hypothetical protein
MRHRYANSSAASLLLFQQKRFALLHQAILRYKYKRLEQFRTQKPQRGIMLVKRGAAIWIAMHHKRNKKAICKLVQEAPSSLCSIAKRERGVK